MDSVFPLKPQTLFLKVPSSLSLLLPLPVHIPLKSSFRFLSASKHVRIQCELEARVNGALSGDLDPRFIDRQKALEAAMNDINNSFGKGSVTRLGSAGGALVETFPSGCLTLDCALGGGLPKGRIVEIFGPESSGKTTLALHAIAEVQKLGGNAMLVDAEHAFDPAYSKALGVDVENLIVCQPDHGEMALEIADRMCRSGAIDLICVDSVSALTPRAEIEGEIGMQQMGLQARLMSQALRKMSGNASKAGCTLIFLNQIRYKIGVYYGNPEVTSGGIALKFFASLRLEVRPIGKIKSAKGDEEIGLKVRVRVQKSKVSRPYKIAEFEIIFGEGVSTLGCILDCAEMMDVVVKKGSWYSYGDHRVRGMSVTLSPSTHVSNNDSWPLLRNVVDCNCAIGPPITTLEMHPQVSLVKTAAIPKLTFVCCSSQRLLSIEELQISVDYAEPSGGAGEYNRSINSVDSSSETSYLNNEVVGLCDSLKPLNEKVLKERIRRMKIGLANKDRVPWNKGRKHTAETRERIRQRTLEALRDPKVRKKMAEHPRYHSDQIKAKISHSQRRVWQERLKSKRSGEKFFFSWEQSIANAARKGANCQEELDWDSYSKIEQQLELHQLLLAEEMEKQKLMAIAGAKQFIQSWRVNIAKAAKKGGSGEQELDWDSYKKIQREIVLLDQLQRTAEKVKAKEMARVKVEKAARMKAIRKVMLMQKRKDSQERTKGRGDLNIQQHGKENEGKGDLEVAQEFKVVSKLTKVQVHKNMSSQIARVGNVFNSIFPTHNKLDMELIKREKMQKEVSLADQIKAARDKKAELH